MAATNALGKAAFMATENQMMLVGYSESTRRYLLQISVACIAVSLVMLFFGQISLIALLIVIASLTSELWLTSRKPWFFSTEGLLYGTTVVPWSSIQRYTKWGPFGIPWTPFKIQGITLYFPDGTLCVSSRSPAFEMLLRKLETLSYPATPEPLWYQYPPQVLRAIRYAIAFAFAIMCLLIFLLSILIILIAVVVVYFIVRSLVQNKRSKSETLPQDAWIAGAGSLILFCVLYYIFQSPYLLFLMILIPIAFVLWFPWQPTPVALISECTFVGKKQAYPLRHLRTAKMVSRFFILKIWQLSFANGDVNVMPFLENFETFKEKLEKQWNDVQHYYRNKKMTEEEAKIRTPSEEARRIAFFEADQIPLMMPLAWQILFPLFLVIHSFVLALILWCVYATPLGRLGLFGVLIREIIPIVLLVYGSYLLFSLLPKIFSLYSRYIITEDGILLSHRRIEWTEIQTVAPYSDANGQRRIALLDTNGKNLITIYEAMSDWEMAFDKIRKKVQAVCKYDPVIKGATELLQNRSHAAYHSRRWAMMILMILILPFLLNNIVQSNLELFQDASQNNPPFQYGYLAVTEPATYIMPGIFGKKLAMIPYQTYTGQTWYGIGIARTLQSDDLHYDFSWVRYLPQSPGYCLLYGDVQDLRIAFCEWLEAYGVSIENIIWIEDILKNSWYVFWILAIFFVIIGLLRQNLFAGLLMQRIPAPLGPSVYLSGTVILNHTLKLVLHALVILVFGLYIYACYFSQNMPVFLRIPFPGIWIVFFILLPMIVFLHLVHYIFVLIPQWLRSFKTWELSSDGISDHRTTLTWSEIQSINVFYMPQPIFLKIATSPRKIALIQGEKGTICLDGELVYFESIVAHLRQKSNCDKNSYNKVKYFYRKKYAQPRLLRILACIGLLFILTFSFNWIRAQQEKVLGIASISEAKINYTLFDTFAIFSYEDEQNHTWTTFGFKEQESEKYIIRYNQKNPIFWESENDKLISMRSWSRYQLLSFISVVHENFELSNKIKDYIWYICLGFLILPLLWNLLGVLFGIPPLEPKSNLEKISQKEATQTAK